MIDDTLYKNWSEIKENVRNNPDDWYVIVFRNGQGSIDSENYREDVYSKSVETLEKYANEELKQFAVDGWYRDVWIETYSGNFVKDIW